MVYFEDLKSSSRGTSGLNFNAYIAYLVDSNGTHIMSLIDDKKVTVLVLDCLKTDRITLPGHPGFYKKITAEIVLYQTILFTRTHVQVFTMLLDELKESGKKQGSLHY
jgi:hypothetical protein